MEIGSIGFLDVLFTVLFLVILVIPGYVLVKTKMLKDGAESVLSTLVLYVAQPVLIFTSFQKAEYSKDIGINMLIVAGLTALIHFIMIGCMFLFIRGKEARKNCCRTASVFSNCGYMGIPFLQMLFGNSNSIVLVYAAVIVSVFNIFDWSFGIFMVSGDKKNINLKNALFNPTIITIFISLIVFLIAQKPLISLPNESDLMYGVLDKLMKSLETIASMVTPLAMMVIGIKLSKLQVKKLLLNKYLYIACFNKLIVMSVISILVVAFLPISEIAKFAVFFGLSMPAATSNVLFAVKFGGDGDMASGIVLLSTILSIISIPVMFLLFRSVCFI